MYTTPWFNGPECKKENCTMSRFGIIYKEVFRVIRGNYWRREYDWRNGWKWLKQLIQRKYKKKSKRQWMVKVVSINVYCQCSVCCPPAVDVQLHKRTEQIVADNEVSTEISVWTK